MGPGLRVPAGREPELEASLTLAVELGATVLAVWGMHGNAAWDAASDRPELVWETIGRTFWALRGC